MYWPTSRVLFATLPIRLDSLSNKFSRTRVERSAEKAIAVPKARNLSRTCGHEYTDSINGWHISSRRSLVFTLILSGFPCDHPPAALPTLSLVVRAFTDSANPDQPRGSFAGFVQGPWEPLWISGPRILVMRTAITRKN